MGISDKEIMCAQALRYEKHDVCQDKQQDGFTGFSGSWRMLGNETGVVGHGLGLALGGN